MSPKESIPGDQILEKAEQLKLSIVEAEAESQKIATNHQSQAIEGLGASLGFDALPSASDSELTDTRITSKEPVISPNSLDKLLGRTAQSVTTVRESRQRLSDIISHSDDRLIAVVGPCSIHDPEATMEYAEQVASWREKHKGLLEVVMRFYVEKPRSELGWKGFIYDPKLDESNDINTGIIASRLLASQITDLGVPIAVERLNALTPQYLNGLVSYDVIGARNAADQKAREYGSGTSSVIGVKNTVHGSIRTASEAVVAMNSPHTFLGMSADGHPAQVETTGNDSAHIVLRGSSAGPNYGPGHIEEARQILKDKGLQMSVVVDASHGNSGKHADKQMRAIHSIAGQVAGGERAIRGVMIEGNLLFGSQKLVANKPLEYGKSITDECVDISEADEMLELLAKAVKMRRTR